MSTHQIREAMELATHVALLERGKIVHAGPRTPEMLLDPGWLYRTYGGDSTSVKQGFLAAFAIARKDLRTELRTKESLNAALSFALVILVLFSFAFDLGRDEFYAISGGLLWLVYSFAGALIVNRSFARELPNDCLDVLIASPAPGWAIFLGKAVAGFRAAADRGADLAAGFRAVLQHHGGRVLAAAAGDGAGHLGHHRRRRRPSARSPSTYGCAN